MVVPGCSLAANARDPVPSADFLSLDPYLVLPGTPMICSSLNRIPFIARLLFVTLASGNPSNEKARPAVSSTGERC